jgi:hypothetical protein
VAVDLAAVVALSVAVDLAAVVAQSVAVDLAAVDRVPAPRAAVPQVPAPEAGKELPEPVRLAQPTRQPPALPKE